MNPYRSYRSADFALDESFQRWVLGADPEAAGFWEPWLARHPKKQIEVDEAQRLLLMLGRVEAPPDAQRNARLKRAILSQVALAPDPPRRPVLYRRRLVACLLLLLLLASGGVWGYRQWAYVSYVTDYGENRSFTLPDGSEVTLKANSRLRHPRRWLANQDREVWLEGEAFFHVTSKNIDNARAQRPASFTVHATELVDVAVLGTEFNVSARAAETEIALKSGSVRVDVKHEAQPQTVLMEPGELVAVHRRGTLTQQPIGAQSQEAWRANMLIFNEVTLATVAKKLQHTYGVTVVFSDPALAQRKFKGFVPTDNLNILLEAFAELYHLQIEQRGNQLTFSKQIK